MEFYIAVCLSAIMALVIYWDITRFRIPNWLNATLLVSFIMYWVLLPEAVDWQSSLVGFSVILLMGFGMFSMNWIGGGDVKLLAVTALFAGFGDSLMLLLLYMGFIGGAMSLFLILARVMVPIIGAKLGAKSIPRVLTQGEPVPYGLAIAAAFLILLWGGHFRGL